jgi:hypothetical protein
MPSVNYVPASEPADPVPRLLDWQTKARAAGWVPLADVLDAVWDIDGLYR